MPTDAVLDLFSMSSLIDDLVDEEFLLAILEDGHWWIERMMGEEVIVIFLEWLYLGHVEDREGVGKMGKMQCYGRMQFISGSD